MTPHLTSMTRIAEMNAAQLSWLKIDRAVWQTGDYVLGSVVQTPARGLRSIERENGRIAEVTLGDRVVGALGTRYATLEVTGSWKDIEEDGRMEMLTSGGLLGRMTSRSAFIHHPIVLKYEGHIMRNDIKRTMEQCCPSSLPEKAGRLEAPIVAVVGSSMSAGKTAAARQVIRVLKRMGKRVLAGKLTGAGRYRDILSMQDAGADCILDFVDAGLPSTVCPEEEFRRALAFLECKMAAFNPDVAVIELGASPLEPYNGDVAWDAIRSRTVFSVLCAMDPYAVNGVMESFAFKPDLVTGVATNTYAGVELIHRLCGIPALNIHNPDRLEALENHLQKALASRKTARNYKQDSVS